jgi:hypothetical protein
MSSRSIEQLRDELRQIEDDLARFSEQERDAERGIDALALRARRGDAQAERQISEHETSCASALNNRRRLQAARKSIEAELQIALTLIEREAVKEKAREAKKILAVFSKRGAAIEAGLRKVLADYMGIQTDMATLANLDMTRINPELVKANCKRAFRAALIPIRTDLEMTLVPPLERRGFADLVDAWAGSAERLINAILNEPEEVSAPTPPAEAVEQAQAGA